MSRDPYRLNHQSIEYLKTLPSDYQLLPEENRFSLPKTGCYVVPCKFCCYEWAYLDNVFHDLLRRKGREYFIDYGVFRNLPAVIDVDFDLMRIVWKTIFNGAFARTYAMVDHHWTEDWVNYP